MLIVYQSSLEVAIHRTFIWVKIMCSINQLECNLYRMIDNKVVRFLRHASESSPFTVKKSYSIWGYNCLHFHTVASLSLPAVTCDWLTSATSVPISSRSIWGPTPRCRPGRPILPHLGEGKIFEVSS